MFILSHIRENSRCNILNYSIYIAISLSSSFTNQVRYTRFYEDHNPVKFLSTWSAGISVS